MQATRQVIGKNTIALYSVDIAKYHKKNDAKKYTSHSFRRTAATILAESGASLTALKAAGGWKSSTVAERYIDQTDLSRGNIARALSIGEAPQQAPTASTSAIAAPSTTKGSVERGLLEAENQACALALSASISKLSISNCVNVTINLNGGTSLRQIASQSSP